MAGFEPEVWINQQDLQSCPFDQLGSHHLKELPPGEYLFKFFFREHIFEFEGVSPEKDFGDNRAYFTPPLSWRL